ncbi:hypothetical protein BJX61DRAFT_541007, partial [Aspergillus egyptiacus]
MAENLPAPAQGFISEAPPLNCIDTGVFINELANLQLLPDTLKLEDGKDKTAYWQNPENLTWKFLSGIAAGAPAGAPVPAPAPDPAKDVTYRGTQLAMLKTYDVLEHRY